MSDYRTFITQTGFGLERDAKFNNTHVDHSVLVVGDGVLPDSASAAEQTDLLHQVREYAITIEKDELDPNVWIARAEIPASDGGFFIKEAGIKTEDGYLYAYARQAGDYKPLLEEGQGKSYTIRLKFVPGNADAIQIKIDPSVQFATPADLENLKKEHLEEQDPHPQYETHEGASTKVNSALNNAKSYTDSKSTEILNSAKSYSENAGNLNNGRVPDDRLSGRYNITVPYAEKFSSDVGRLFTDVNSAYFSNNVNQDRYTRIGDGYASRIWLDRAVGSIKIQYGGYGLAGTAINWVDSLTIDGRGSVVQFVGIVASFPALGAPLGWLKLQGGELSRSAYLSLFDFAVASGNMAESEVAKDLGQFGPGDGSTTFTLPDPQGMTIRVLDEVGGVEAGREIGSYRPDQIKSHTHEYDTLQGSGVTNSVSDNVASSANTSTPTGKTTSATGGTENTVKNIAWPLYIKY